MIMQRRRSFEQVQAQTRIDPDRLSAVDAAWRAANYLVIAQLYLQDNALLRRPLKFDDIKPRLCGRWGDQPALNMVYVHLNRLIQDSDANVLLAVGPACAAPAILANLFLEGTLCEYYPQLDRDEAGINELARQFGWPDGVPDHLTARVPGMIQQGTEVGSSLAHAAGAAFDNPDLTVACVITDAEAETGPLLAGWQSNRFLNPVRDGAVLPILHLGGYRTSGPSVLGRMDNDELDNLLTGFGYQIGIVAGDDPHKTHEAMWQAMDWAFGEIRDLQEQSRVGGVPERPAWPMLIFRTPTGWTAPREIDGLPVEGTPRAHGLPVPDPRGNPEHLKILEQWLRGCGPQDLFDAAGGIQPLVTSVCPRGDRRIGRNPHANGGALRVDLSLPRVGDYAVSVASPGATVCSVVEPLAEFLRDTLHQAAASRNFRLFCPDDAMSRWMPFVLEATGRAWMWPTVDTDELLSPDGRILEISDVPTCQGWLEGYLLAGRHGLLICREQALSVALPELQQYARWLKDARAADWRKPVASLTCVLVGDPADAVAPAGLMQFAGDGPVRIYLPADANSLLCVVEQCLRSLGRINVVFTTPAHPPQWLGHRAAGDHCARGASAWDWAGDSSGAPDVVLAAAGAAETVEVLAAAQLLRRELADLRLRVVNVVDLSSLQRELDDVAGLTDDAFACLFPVKTPVVFAMHGPAGLVRELIRERPDASRFLVLGHSGQDGTTTAFDLLVRNGLSRFHLAIAAIEQTPRLREAGGPLIDRLRGNLVRQEQSIRRSNQDLSEVAEWRWG
jgi:xylulose-5-phosphate/fructose-6-phosphate phosphoketolase